MARGTEVDFLVNPLQVDQYVGMGLKISMSDRMPDPNKQ